MKVELEEDDILYDIKENHFNKPQFLIRIVDAGTTGWEPYKEVARAMLKELKANGELDIDELLNG